MGEKIPDGVAGDLFCLLCAHGLAAAAGAGIIRRRGAAVKCRPYQLVILPSMSARAASW